MGFKELKKHIMINGKLEKKRKPYRGDSKWYKNMLKYKKKKQNEQKRYA